MTAAAPRRQPNCIGLPVAVVDKYFMADPRTERFQYLTAQAMCGGCVVQAACLVEAIQLPATDGGVRGGESAGAVTELRRRFRRGEATAEALALDAVALQRARGGVRDSPSLRAGKFSDLPLLTQPISNRRGGVQ